MKIYRFFENLRKKYLKNILVESRHYEYKKLNMIDDVVLSWLNRFKNKSSFIQNNRLFTYIVFLREKGILYENLDKKILYSVTHRMRKTINTLKVIELIGKEIGCKFLIIKSLNIIPYLPIYDIDIFVNNRSFLKSKVLYKYFEISKEREVNKINFTPKNPYNHFKLSFHSDITWDGVKIMKIEKNIIEKNNIKIMPHVYINSPQLEALVRVQECILERLYFNFIDYLFISNYLKGELDIFLKLKENDEFPVYIRYKDLIRYNSKTLFKNLSRRLIWSFYTKITKKVPFYEKYKLCL